MGDHNGYEHFLRFHMRQLMHFEVPQSLWPILYKKLKEGSFDLAESFKIKHKAVVATQDIGINGIWPVQHLIRAPRGPDLINALKQDPGLLLCVAAAALQDGHESEEDDADLEHDPEDIYAPLFASVLRQLHRVVFMYEVPKELRDTTIAEPTSNRMRYIPEPVAAQMGLGKAKHVNIQIVPFFWLYPDHDSHERVSCVEQICVAWATCPIQQGAPAIRCKLPLGLADYSNPDMWMEAYRGEAENEEWYCDGTAEFLAVLRKHWQGHSTSNQPKILLPGCGNSTLGVQLYRGGFTEIINLDLVQQVIEQMAQQFPPEQFPGLIWLQGDVTSLKQFPDGSFDFILDKACLDALLTAGAESATRWRDDSQCMQCALSSEAQSMAGGTVGLVAEQQQAGLDKADVTDSFGGLSLSVRYLLEMQRLLKKSGTGHFAVMSLRLPQRFQQVLEISARAATPSLHWKLEEHESLPACSAFLYTCATA